MVTIMSNLPVTSEISLTSGIFISSQVREAGLIRGQVPIAPTSANLHFSNRTVSNVPRSNDNARFFTHQQPSPAQRVPFAQQQRSFEAGNRGAQAPAVRESAPRGGFGGNQQPGGVTRGTQNSTNGSAGGWRRFGEPAGQNASPQGSSPRGENNLRGSAPNRFENTRPPSASEAPANRGGWQRFGEPGSVPRQGNSGSGGYSTPRYNAPPQSRDILGRVVVTLQA